MRNDYTVIHDISNFYGLLFAKDIQSLPYFEIPDSYKKEIFDGYNTTGEYYTYSDEGEKYVKNGKRAICDPNISQEILPFTRFAVMGDPFGYGIVTRFVNKVTGLGGWSLTLKLDKVLHLTNQVLPAYLAGCLVNVRIADMKNKGTIEILESLKIETNLTISCIQSDVLKMDYKDIDDTLMKVIGDSKENSGAMLSSILFLLTFFIWADSRHLVKVTGGNAKKKLKDSKKLDKKPWLRNDLPSYIYLDSHTDSVVNNSSTSTNNTSTLAMGHPRRSHWRTMTHERFKNHPFFNIPMRVKETWVGPREWVHTNKTYTIHEDV